jgi:hypothetical protein
VADRGGRISEVFGGGPVYIFGKRMRGPSPYNSRKVTPAFTGVAFPPVKTGGEMSFTVPDGVGRDMVFAAAFINMNTREFVSVRSPVEFSNRCTLRSSKSMRAGAKGIIDSLRNLFPR